MQKTIGFVKQGKFCQLNHSINHRGHREKTSLFNKKQARAITEKRDKKLCELFFIYDLCEFCG